MPVIKGVLADDKLEQEAIRQQKWIERMEREEIVERMTRGALMKPGVSSISASAQAQKREHCKSKKEPRMTGTTRRTFWYDIDSKEYDNFSKPVVLRVDEVDPTLYSKAVDATDPRIYLVVHLYETYVPAYRDLIHYLERISQTSMTHVRFCPCEHQRLEDENHDGDDNEAKRLWWCSDDVDE